MKVLSAYVAPGSSYQEVKASVVRIMRLADEDESVQPNSCVWILDSNVIRMLSAMKNHLGRSQFANLRSRHCRMLFGRPVERVIGAGSNTMIAVFQTR
jgi:hypothetical protein